MLDWAARHASALAVVSLVGMVLLMFSLWVFSFCTGTELLYGYAAMIVFGLFGWWLGTKETQEAKHSDS